MCSMYISFKERPCFTKERSYNRLLLDKRHRSHRLQLCLSALYNHMLFEVVIKKSIQLQVPLQLPCYDFASISSSLLNLKNILSIDDLPVFDVQAISMPVHIAKILQPGRLSKRDGQEVQSSGTVSPWRADPRLLVIPASCPRVAEGNPKYDGFYRFAPTCVIASLCAPPL